jgi:hypothetical protein
MTVHDPPDASRRRESGFKGNGWTDQPENGYVLPLVTGRDSIFVIISRYTDRRSVVPRYPGIMGRTTFVAVDAAAPEGVAR